MSSTDTTTSTGNPLKPKMALATTVMERHLASLEPHHQEVLTPFLAGKKYYEISQAIPLPIGTVRSRLHRAKHRVLELERARLEDETQLKEAV